MAQDNASTPKASTARTLPAGNPKAWRGSRAGAVGTVVTSVMKNLPVGLATVPSAQFFSWYFAQASSILWTGSRLRSLRRLLFQSLGLHRFEIRRRHAAAHELADVLLELQ